MATTKVGNKFNFYKQDIKVSCLYIIIYVSFDFKSTF